ncbi:ROK family protein [Homoserinimonas sp. A447]
MGRETDHLVYINGGASGIGGGVIVNGQPYRGGYGYAGELGHNRQRLDNPAHRATVGGTLEDDVSRAQLLSILGMRTADEAQFEAAVLESSAPALQAELARQQHVLGGAIANAINVLGPQLVVLGGFMATLLTWDSEVLEREVAALAQDRLLIGAAEITFGEVLRDPLVYAQC